MSKMQKAESKTMVKVTQRVKCACPGCGVNIIPASGFKSSSGLCCTQAHADIAETIKGK